MKKPQHVLAVTDFSEGSDEALRQANGYARMTGAKLSVLHVIPNVMHASPLLPSGSTGDVDREVAMEQSALDDLWTRTQEVTGRPRNDVELAVRIGPVDAAAVRYAEEHGVDVLVVGATGRTGLARLLLGSTAERVIRHAHCTVLVARPSPASEHVLVATDLSDAALAAVERAKAEVEWREARLDLLHVMDFSALGWPAAAGPFGGFAAQMPVERIAQMRQIAVATLQGLGGPEAKVHVIEGAPKRGIVATAEEIPAGLIVLSTHGRTGLARMALGSVAEAVSRVAHCSVLVVRAEPPAPKKTAAGNFE